MKFALSILLVLAMAPTAFAAKKAAPAHSAPAYNDSSSSGGVAGEPDTDGCGLGWQVTNKKTIIASITRGTTNGVVPPSFGMTSGTLGCAQHPFAMNDRAGATYAVTNYETLKLELASGSGEFLDGFARTMGCNDSAVFGRVMQQNYGQIIEGGKVTPVRLFLNVKEQIKRDATLAGTCAV